MYDHDPEEVEDLGWEEFIVLQWESIFVGYRSWVGLRAISRRWSDFFEVGLDCSPAVADRLVRAVIINGPDRHLGDAADAQVLVSGMIDVLVDLQVELDGRGDLGPKLSARLVDQQTQLLRFVRKISRQHEDQPLGP